MVLDETGTSKGFGFIRFGNETEQQTALTTMQGIAGLGDRPIKVNISHWSIYYAGSTDGEKMIIKEKGEY